MARIDNVETGVSISVGDCFSGLNEGPFRVAGYPQALDGLRDESDAF